MIRNQWYVVLESNEVGAQPVGVTRLGEKLVFWRDPEGKVNAAVDRCPHRGAALSIGKMQSGHLQCPFHGFEYDPSGKCVLVPANGRTGVIPNAMLLKTYPTQEAHGLIWLWWVYSQKDHRAWKPHAGRWSGRGMERRQDALHLRLQP
jgi:phenylpropionate dioxygenase-like ring-hydroxylating dioxygenase large terminal subunit